MATVEEHLASPAAGTTKLHTMHSKLGNKKILVEIKGEDTFLGAHRLLLGWIHKPAIELTFTKPRFRTTNSSSLLGL